jgi:hypothetical protein
MKIEKIDLNDVKDTLTRIVLMKACENYSHDVLISIYFTKTNDSFNLDTFDVFVRIVFHSTLFIVDETLMKRNSRKSVLIANILISDNICFSVLEWSIDIVFFSKYHIEMKRMIWWKKKKKRKRDIIIYNERFSSNFLYIWMRRESYSFSSHMNATRIVIFFITQKCNENHIFFHHIRMRRHTNATRNIISFIVFTLLNMMKTSS